MSDPNTDSGRTLLDRPGLVIAEVAQAHDGSLGTAHAYVDAVARAGADAVKFQTHIAAAESTPGEPWRVRFSPQDPTRYDYWKRMEFTPEQWRGLADHARDAGLVFLSTPFSFEAADLLEELDVPAWKVGSGELTNLPFLERLAETGRPVILSTGMASWAEIDRAVEVVRSAGAPVAVLQCTTSYPVDPERVGLNVIPELRERFDCAVGLSDHSGSIVPGLAAAAFGADLLEVHTVFSRECFGPDTSSSVTTGELAQLVEGVRMIRTMLENPVEKDAMARELHDLKRTFQKSVVAARALPAGHVIRREDLGLRKPGTGIPAAEMDSVVGLVVARPLESNQLIESSDVRES